MRTYPLHTERGCITLQAFAGYINTWRSASCDQRSYFSAPPFVVNILTNSGNVFTDDTGIKRYNANYHIVK